MSECDKMIAVQEQSQSIGEFLDWLDQNKIVLAKWEPGRRVEDRLIVISESTERLLAKYFDIDLEQVDREQREVCALMATWHNERAKEVGDE